MKKQIYLALMIVLTLASGLSSCSDNDEENAAEYELVTSFDDLQWFFSSCSNVDEKGMYSGISIGCAPADAPAGVVYMSASNMEEAQALVLGLLPPGKSFVNNKVELSSEDGKKEGVLEMRSVSLEDGTFAELVIDADMHGNPLKTIRFTNNLYSSKMSPYVPGDVVFITWKLNDGKGAPVYTGYRPPCYSTQEIADTIIYQRESTYRYWETHVLIQEMAEIIKVKEDDGPFFWVCIKPASETERGILAHIMPKESAESSNNGYATLTMAQKVGAIYRTNKALYTRYFLQVRNLPTVKEGGNNVLKEAELWTSDYKWGFFSPDLYTYNLNSGNTEKYGWTHPEHAKLRVYEFDINGKLYPNMRNT